MDSLFPEGRGFALTIGPKLKHQLHLTEMQCRMIDDMHQTPANRNQKILDLPNIVEIRIR